MKKLLPTTYLFIYLILLLVLDLLFPVIVIIQPPYHLLVGLILVVFGIVINFWADRLFKQKKTSVKPLEKPSSLIVGGPFSFTRHPMYLGFVSILLGMAFILNNAVTLLVPMVMLLTMEKLFISQEEKNLEEVFGSKYSDYQKRVRRWL